MKQVISPSKHWAGHVILHDPLNYAQVSAIETAQDEAAEVKPSSLLSVKDENGATVKELYWSSDLDHLWIKPILLCVKEWHIENLPQPLDVDNFPMSPRNGKDSATAFVRWLRDEIYKIYEGEIEIPNES